MTTASLGTRDATDKITSATIDSSPGAERPVPWRRRRLFMRLHQRSKAVQYLLQSHFIHWLLIR